MNERIKELITEADAYAWTIAEKYVPECGEVNYLWEYAFRKKFAELIVKECIGVCGQVAEDAHKQKESSFLTADGKQLYNGVWGGAMNCGAGIANHFGIEK